MAVSRVQHVDKQFRDRIAQKADGFLDAHWQTNEHVVDGTDLTAARAVELLDVQMTSRWIDFVARELKADGRSFYTIGSSGHEGNAMVGMASRFNDPAFLHYRSGGFVFARARQRPAQTPIFDTCLSLTASIEDPISAGRHKVWGSTELFIPPQTSTIASHLPKAMGTAFFLERMKRFNRKGPFPEDAIIICSFGDASVNHASATSAINAACWTAHQNLPVPVLFVCEDNGLGISVHTPGNWVQSNFSHREGLTYFQADGLDFRDGYATVQEAVDTCRNKRRPVFLHLKTVRMLGHAGSDVEIMYRELAKIEAMEARDPVLKTALGLIELGILSPRHILNMYDQIGAQVRAAGKEAATRDIHISAKTVSWPLYPDYQAVDLEQSGIDPDRRQRHWDGRLPEDDRPRHLAVQINRALHDLMLADDDVVLFGEDVARKGGVYRVTADLRQKFGLARVFNTLLDETTILGLAIGAGHNGLMPIPEIQYLAYLHNAIDQLRGEACSMKYFSNNQYHNPMLVRIASFAYQRGFGGHFHNDNSFASLREIPGIVIVTASNGADAARLLRSCVTWCKKTGAVIVFMEPIALYMTKDLVGKGDWCFPYPEPNEMMPFGEVGLYGPEDADILAVTYGNGTYLTRQAVSDMEGEGKSVRVLDLRFLAPLNRAALLAESVDRKEIIIIDECRQTASVSEEITAQLVEGLGSRMPGLTRICGDDTYIPLGPAWEKVLPSRESIYEALSQAWERLHG